MKIDKPKISKSLVVPAIRGTVLGVPVYRGFSKLCDLADLSKADIYDSDKNPTGTQRDLSSPHARDAHEYVKTHDLGFWPEVFLCARDKRCITFQPISDEHADIGFLQFDLQKIQKDKTAISISRVDGNHRLHFADGKSDGFSRIQKDVSFCLAYDLSREQEIQLFKDINQNQKAMNTSHLDGIEVRLTPEEELKRNKPQLFIAEKLATDNDSPFHGRIHLGGKRASNADIPLRALKTGIEYLLTRSTQLPQAPDVDAKYKLIRNYFAAVKLWQPKSWTDPKVYLTLRGAGFWAICFLGAHVIDRALNQDKYDVNDLLGILRSGKEWDWSKNGDFKGFSGRSGALEISKRVAAKLHDEKRMSTSKLFEKIMATP